ncbi:MAG: major capsid protein [Pseudomonadota bacterium]
MQALDISNNDAFSVISLTDTINKLPYLPGQAGRLGIFEETGVSTTTVMLEEAEGKLSLIPTTPRGAPAVQNKINKRKARSLAVPHLTLEDTILADEVQNRNVLGRSNELATVQTIVNTRLKDMVRWHDITLEHLRIGAVKGQILDADGSTVLYDLFTEFGVSQHTEIDFDLDNGSPAAGAVKKKCHDVTRKIADELGGASFNYVHAFCSASFFDDLVTHPEVEESYRRYQESAFLREGHARKAVEYAGIVFEEYYGGNSGGSFIPDNKAHFFPVGVPGLFRQYNAPADFVETVNTLGLPRYAKQAIDQEFGRWVKLHTQSNPLPICTRPRTLIKAKRT